MDLQTQHRLSRQIYSIGATAQAKLSQARVLLVGLSAVGAEIAKNLLLMGVPWLGIYDNDQVVTTQTPSVNFLVHAEDLGKNVVDAALPELRSLAPLASISRVSSVPSYSSYSVVVCARSGRDLCQIGEECHQQGLPFISAQVCGAYSRLFCDLGPDHHVHEDAAFEFRVLDAKHHSVSNNEFAVVRLLAEADEITAAISPGQMVVLSGSGLSDQIVEVTDVDPKACTLALRASATKLQAKKESTGIYVKENPRVIQYCQLKLSEVLQKPLMDRRPGQQLDHLCFLALDIFMARHGRVPDIQEEVSELANILMTSLQGAVDQTTAQLFAYGCRGELAPLAAVVGGLAAQEVVKSISGKGHPVNQLYYHSEPSLVSLEPSPSLSALSKELLAKLANLRLFLVGCGAIGCEALKNLALLGVSTGKNGVLHATDPDHIEASNLCRQFLFRDADIKRSKSVVALERVKLINPQIKVVAHDVKVGPGTENVFSEAFYNNTDIVCNALDNFDARYYVDRRCTAAKKPLLDPGTEGMALSLKVIIPWVTNTFSDQVLLERREKTIPICTIRSFPTKSEHTLMWAKDRFALHFTKGPNVLLSYLRGETIPPEEAKLLLGFWKDGKLFSLEDCVHWARSFFEENYYSDIALLLKLHPPGSQTESGEFFWNDARLQPDTLSFDISNTEHLDFVLTAAQLKASTLGYQFPSVNVPNLTSLLTAAPNAWKRYAVRYVSDVQDMENSSSRTSAMETDKLEFSNLDKYLHSQVPNATDAAGIQALSDIQSIDFEKDDELHMQFVASAANLRSQNYNIRPLELNEARRVVGNIIPAIVTTTAVAAGLLTLQLVKVVNLGLHWLHQDNLADYKGRVSKAEVSRINEYSWLLSRPMGWSPMPIKRNVKQMSFGNTKITPWDAPILPDMSLRGLLDHLSHTYGISGVDSVRTQTGGMIFFPFFNSSHALPERLDKRLTELWDMTKENGSARPRLLHFIVTDLSEDEISVHICY